MVIQHHNLYFQKLILLDEFPLRNMESCPLRGHRVHIIIDCTVHSVGRVLCAMSLWSLCIIAVLVSSPRRSTRESTLLTFWQLSCTQLCSACITRMDLLCTSSRVARDSRCNFRTEIARGIFDQFWLANVFPG